MELYDRGIRLQELRKKCNLSQKEAAKRLGVSRATVSAYERNIKSPSIETLERMALLYHASVDFMLGLEHRTCFYIDDLTEHQQKTILGILELLRSEFQETNKQK
jgi:transcriptional regulator with XRE-family HTH domain